MGKNISLTFNEKILLRDSIGLRQKKEGFKKFAKELIQGWFPNTITKDHKYGVHKIRVVDKLSNFYKEYVKDLRTGKIIRNVEEKLTDHRK